MARVASVSDQDRLAEWRQTRCPRLGQRIPCPRCGQPEYEGNLWNTGADSMCGPCYDDYETGHMCRRDDLADDPDRWDDQ